MAVCNSLGLHARAAGQLVRLATSFKSRIRVCKKDGSAEADARSMLSLLGLGASQGTVLTIQAEGPDAAEALAAVRDLFLSGFGEN